MDGTIHGVGALLTVHTVVGDATRSANVLHMDTGAGFRNGRLTLARIDVDPIETLTMNTG